ncbi:unknown protein (Partial), partial [Seminavis robusta]
TQVDNQEDEKEEEVLEEEEEDEVEVPTQRATHRSQAAARVEEVSQLLNGAVSKERQKRGKNFTPEEDELLSKAWVSTTMDSHNGSDQRQADFNKKLYSNYQDLVEETNEVTHPELPMDRKQKSIVSRFSTIKHGVNKMIGIMKMHPIKSGETIEQHETRCLEIFEETHNTKFPWIDCYHVLENCPKFSAADDSGKTKANGKKGKKHKRSQGKRQKALDDRIQRMLDNKGLGNNNPAGTRAVQEAASVSEAIGQISTHLVDQVAVSQWSENDKEEYFKNDAMEKKLLQQRRILKLQLELDGLKKVQAKSGGTSSSDDEE